MDQIARTPKDVGVALRNACKAMNLTQEALGARSAIWARTIAVIETDAAGMKLDTLFDLCAALDLEVRIAPRSKAKSEDMGEIL